MRLQQGASRRSLFIALMLCFSLIAAACGSDGSSSTDDDVDDGSTTTAAMEDGDEPAEDGDDEDAAPAEPIAEGELTLGLLLVGPQDDRGWSQAHFEGANYAIDKVGGEVITVDLVNPADKPEITVEQIVDDMIDQGANAIFATSDDMKDGILTAAANHPDVPMLWASGDSAWEDGADYKADLTNLSNIMGRMEYGKMIAGCAAALSSDAGDLGYVGALINDETRRLTSAAYLGAQHCWQEAGNDAADLSFAVNWIGFWFNIPGVTLDPTDVTNNFIDGGSDVVLSGIDTTEAITRSGQRAEEGESVSAVPYDYIDACDQAPDVCLGVPYFNWGPAYTDLLESVADGSYEASWTWLEPNWDDINDLDSSAIGFVKGDGLAAEDAETLDAFIAGLADGSIDPFTGPLNFQDGSEFLADGVTATDADIWYMSQLLEGMEGASSAE